FKVTVVFIGLAVACLFVADLHVSTQDPWTELGRLARGFLTPSFLDLPELLDALAQTLAFALLGVAAGAGAGFGLALVFRYRAARVLASSLRSVHELFWALVFLQFLGLNAVTGILAIALPYTGIFAKVFAEMLEEADPGPLRA